MAVAVKTQNLPGMKKIRDIPKEEYYLPGHRTCAGCGPAINIQHVLGGLQAAVPDSKTSSRWCSAARWRR